MYSKSKNLYLSAFLIDKKYYLFIKRLFDISFSLIALLLLAPAIIVFSIAILIETGSPIFYIQDRCGRYGKKFKIYKLRSMKNIDGFCSKETLGECDPRITKIGQLIRKYKLDEIPQLINVIKGDMSLVGPRPEIPHYALKYMHLFPEIFNIRPGITDLSSLYFSNLDKIISRRGDIPVDIYYSEKVLPKKLRLQRYYVKRVSMCLDIHILFRTIQKILKT